MGPEIKREVTSPSWENREKFAASRVVFTDRGHTTEAWLYYKLICALANLFFLYFNIRPNNKTKINKKTGGP